MAIYRFWLRSRFNIVCVAILTGVTIAGCSHSSQNPLRQLFGTKPEVESPIDQQHPLENHTSTQSLVADGAGVAQRASSNRSRELEAADFDQGDRETDTVINQIANFELQPQSDNRLPLGHQEDDSQQSPDSTPLLTEATNDDKSLNEIDRFLASFRQRQLARDEKLKSAAEKRQSETPNSDRPPMLLVSPTRNTSGSETQIQTEKSPFETVTAPNPKKHRTQIIRELVDIDSTKRDTRSQLQNHLLQDLELGSAPRSQDGEDAVKSDNGQLVSAPMKLDSGNVQVDQDRKSVVDKSARNSIRQSEFGRVGKSEFGTWARIIKQSELQRPLTVEADEEDQLVQPAIRTNSNTASTHRTEFTRPIDVSQVGRVSVIPPLPERTVLPIRLESSVNPPQLIAPDSQSLMESENRKASQILAPINFGSEPTYNEPEPSGTDWPAGTIVAIGIAGFAIWGLRRLQLRGRATQPD